MVESTCVLQFSRTRGMIISKAAALEMAQEMMPRDRNNPILYLKKLSH